MRTTQSCSRGCRHDRAWAATSASVRGTHSTVKPTDASSNAEPLSSAEAYHAQKSAVHATLTANSSKAR